MDHIKFRKVMLWWLIVPLTIWTLLPLLLRLYPLPKLGYGSSDGVVYGLSMVVLAVAYMVATFIRVDFAVWQRLSDVGLPRAWFGLFNLWLFTSSGSVLLLPTSVEALISQRPADLMLFRSQFSPVFLFAIIFLTFLCGDLDQYKVSDAFKRNLAHIVAAIAALHGTCHLWHQISKDLSWMPILFQIATSLNDLAYILSLSTMISLRWFYLIDLAVFSAALAFIWNDLRTSGVAAAAQLHQRNAISTSSKDAKGFGRRK